jgi:DNA-binding NarL/FixJ family response regulator
MQAQDLVLLQCDSTVAQSLVAALSSSFRSIHHVGSLDEVRSSIAKHRASIAILDIERASFSDVERLSHDFPAASIVCTHRCADEEMWTAALNAGAADLLPSSDTRGIVQAALKTGATARSAAA